MADLAPSPAPSAAPGFAPLGIAAGLAGIALGLAFGPWLTIAGVVVLVTFGRSWLATEMREADLARRDEEHEDPVVRP